MFSLFGFLQEGYSPGWRLAFNRVELEPWWGAWVPQLLAGTAAAVLAGLFLVWAILATLYSLPAWLIGFFANRQLSWSGSWRLSGAALMPGALLVTTAAFLYSLGFLDLIQFTAAVGIHFVIGWVYFVVGTLALPHHPSVSGPGKNPFVGVTPRAPPPTSKLTR